ncbi:MAG: nitroreductase family protein [Elusimicrobiota bacterium]|nr:nitroreductase family protein [Elusimicrobiota bacterium]
MDIFFDRKSVRKYTNEEVKDEDLNYILRSAMSAPTAKNTRCYSFIVIKDKTTHAEIAKRHEAAQMILQAPLAILVVGDESLAYNSYFPQDCSAATENILLAAVAKGYGAVWCGVYSNEKRQKALEEFFKLPPNIRAFSLVIIGKSADDTPAKNGWDETKIKYERWQ